MKSENGLTPVELIEKLNSIKDAFCEHGSEQNLYMSLRDLLRDGFEDHLLDKEVCDAFVSIFIGHNTSQSMALRSAIVSAIRDATGELCRREIKKKIITALVQHPLSAKDNDLRRLINCIGIPKGLSIHVEKVKHVPV